VSSLSGGDLLASTDISESGVTLGDVVGLDLDGATLEGSGIRVEVDESLVVGEGVLAVSGSDGVLLGTEMRLNLSRVDDTTKISVSDGSAGEDEAMLLGGNSGLSKDGVKSVEGILGPDDEATNMTSRGELEEVETVDIGDLNTSQVTEGGTDGGFTGSDEEGTTTLDETAVAALSLSGAETTRVLNLLDIFISVN
jgi:hypothetical protein